MNRAIDWYIDTYINIYIYIFTYLHIQGWRLSHQTINWSYQYLGIWGRYIDLRKTFTHEAIFKYSNANDKIIQWWVKSLNKSIILQFCSIVLHIYF